MKSYRLPLVSTGAPAPPAGLLDADASPEEVVVAYHERTKHHFHRYAASSGYMDWATQPDPFQRYQGADLVRLPLPKPGRPFPYWQLHVLKDGPAEPLSLESLSLFFRYALSLTAWKRVHETRWSLRSNPSSGNLHPTEGYAVLPAIERLGAAPAVYHYAPKAHALERRAILDANAWGEIRAPFPEGSFFVGLSSVHWREAWKYGERAFRYCQHDAGHALATLRIAAAALGWGLVLFDWISDSAIAGLFGLSRGNDYGTAEREEPELLALVTPGLLSTFPQVLNGVTAGGIGTPSPHSRVEACWPPTGSALVWRSAHPWQAHGKQARRRRRVAPARRDLIALRSTSSPSYEPREMEMSEMTPEAVSVRSSVLVANTLIDEYAIVIARFVKAWKEHESDEQSGIRAELERVYAGIWEQLDSAATRTHAGGRSIERYSEIRRDPQLHTSMAVQVIERNWGGGEVLGYAATKLDIRVNRIGIELAQRASVELQAAWPEIDWHDAGADEPVPDLSGFGAKFARWFGRLVGKSR